MKFIAVTLLICFFAAFTLAADKPSIKLDVFHQSSEWWMAIAVRDADVDTRTLQVRQQNAFVWEALQFNGGWGYYTLYTNGAPIQFPVSVRLYSTDGKEITLYDIIRSPAPLLIDTNANYDGAVVPTNPTAAPTAAATTAPAVDATAAPTAAATAAPTNAATQAPTVTPTQAPTAAATQAATRAPTAAATSKPTRTKRPTSSPTGAPTNRPATANPTQGATAAATSRPSAAATSSPTAAATSRPTAAATSRPSTRPSVAATSRPTSVATAAATSRPTTASSGSGCDAPIKIMVPLYMYPGSQWDTVIASAGKVKTVAIINPSSGPGTGGPSNTFKTYMTKFDNAGIEMIGYVHTSYGSRSITTVKKEIDEYASKFPSVVGIFLDEVSAKDSELAYYKELYRYIMSMPGWKYDVINPGATPTAGYLDAATQIVSFETDASKFASSKTPSFASCANKDKFSVITYGASSSTMRTVVDSARTKGYYGWVYATDGTLNGGTYNTLPSYYGAMAQYIADTN